MDAEFLELIHTFQKASKRMNTLNETMLGFKQVVQTLQQEMDQLVEMVELEGIVELAQKTTATLNEVHASYDAMNASYERFIDINAMKERYEQGNTLLHEELNLLRQDLSKTLESLINQPQTLSQRLSQIENLAILHEAHLYEKSGSNLTVSSLDGVLVKTFEGVDVSQFQLVNDTLFIQNAMDACLYVVKDLNIQVVAQSIGNRFFVKDYHIYHVLNECLIKTDLLWNTTEEIAVNVSDFSLQGEWLIYVSEGIVSKLKV
ncbi:MAG TPA: hypothetical protein DCY20_08055 [Firmicutes bacterium]|nr:hypothetical protein [Bacillota bacterium]